MHYVCVVNVLMCVCRCVCGVLVMCNFDVDARVCVSKNTGKKTLTLSLAVSDQ
jgi:hypothetical protein